MFNYFVTLRADFPIVRNNSISTAFSIQVLTCSFLEKGLKCLLVFPHGKVTERLALFEGELCIHFHIPFLPYHYSSLACQSLKWQKLHYS